MIQRIQSVYLLIVAILSVIVISNPIGSFVGTDNSITELFIYKKRMLQIRFTLFNIILAIGSYVAVVAFVFMLKGDATFVPSWIVCLPFVGIVLDWLAIRAIGKDEMLVKAYERLR